MSLWEGRRAPMTLLGGYLGAGKTTIVNRALADAGAEGRRIAVLVNDLGAVGVDAGLIAAQHADSIELANGCICCSLVDGLAVALETLRDRPEPPDHVLVELSGVAEPDRVVPWASTAGFRLDGVVVAADADQIRARAADPRLTDLVRAQLGAADVVLVTKTDLADPTTVAEVEAWLAAQTVAPQMRVIDGAVSIDVVLGPWRSKRAPAPPVGDGVGVEHAHAVVSVVGVDPDELLTALDAAVAVDGVVRVKGTVTTSHGGVLVQAVGRRTQVTPWQGRTDDVLVIIGLDAGAVAAAEATLGSLGPASDA